MRVYRTSILLSFILGICIFILFQCSYDQRKNQLTGEEKLWLKKNNNTIRLAFGYEAPPNAFHDSKGSYVGILVDYAKLLEKKLGISFRWVMMPTWTDLMKALQMGKVDIAVGIAYTEERAKYLLFTKPFVEIPYVIIVKQTVEGEITGKDLFGKSVAISKSYAVKEFLDKTFPGLKYHEVVDNLRGLQRVSFGTSDAMIVNQLYGSYLIEKNGITNLRVGGNSGYLNKLRMATTKNNKILFAILTKIAEEISNEEFKRIYRRYVKLEPKYTIRPMYVLMGALALLSFFLFIVTWNIMLTKKVNYRTAELQYAVSDLETANVQLHKMNDEKEILLKEIHHRVKNNMQIISSLIDLQTMSIDDENAKKHFEDSQSRIRSMALVHEKLYLSKNLAQVNIREYLSDLLDGFQKTWSRNTKPILHNFNVADILLDIDDAINCGLIVNELVTNCYKYAFNGREKGAISITFKEMKSNKFYLSVADDGPGFPVSVNLKEMETLGLRLVKVLTAQLNGDVTFENHSGALCTVVF